MFRISYMKQLKLPCIASNSAKWYNHFGKKLKIPFKGKHVPTYGPAILFTQKK